MKCGIHNCAQTDNRFLWRCYGTCKRTFHAACVGAQRNHEEVLRTFMLPVCQDCQDKFITELNLKALTASLRNISDNIGSTLEANHKLLSNLKTLSATHDDTLSNTEKMLSEIKQSISTVTYSNKANSEELKNTLSSLLDTPPDTCTIETAAKSAATAAVAAITTTTTTGSLHSVLTALKDDLMDSHAILAGDVKSHMVEASTPQHNCEATLHEILEEVKFVSQAVSSLQTNSAATVSLPQKTLEEELIENPPVSNESAQPKIDHSSPGWRFLGNKWHWMQDWSKYDAKQQTRLLQEKAAEKARRNRKRRKQQQNNKPTNNNINSNRTTRNNSNINNTKNNSNIKSNNNCNHTTNNNNNASDKNLLLMAKTQFAGPPASIEHPIAGLSTIAAKSSFTNFQKGETIHPYRNDKQTQHDNTESPPAEITSESTPIESQSTPRWSPDPMRPPIVNLTQQSADGDGRFLKARLRDTKIMYLVRLYLAYMYDKDSTFCYEGMTNTSIKLNLASEGLPVTEEELQQIFFEVHEEFGVPRKAASDDLLSYRRHLNSQRIQYLQRLRESDDKFHNPNFRK